MKNCLISMPQELHKQLKILAAQKGTTLKDIIVECLTIGYKNIVK